MYTKEKAGILKAERLRDALYDVGFQLSTDIMAILMLRYMRKDGTLRMGDFVSAILHLTTAFGKNLDLNSFVDLSQKCIHLQKSSRRRIVIKIILLKLKWLM